LERQTQIQKNLFNDQYLAPAAMNRTMDSSGNYSDLDFRGNVRTSNLSSIPQIAPAFMDYLNQVAVPQRITSPFGGGGAGNVNINIQALDGQDVKRVLMNNPEAVADSVQNAVYKGGSALADTMRNL
jgi:Flp pilus assembly secretin CpaC